MRAFEDKNSQYYMLITDLGNWIPKGTIFVLEDGCGCGPNELVVCADEVGEYYKFIHMDECIVPSNIIPGSIIFPESATETGLFIPITLERYLFEKKMNHLEETVRRELEEIRLALENW